MRKGPPPEDESRDRNFPLVVPGLAQSEVPGVVQGPASISEKREVKTDLSKMPPFLKDAEKGQERLTTLGINVSQEIDHSETGKGKLPQIWRLAKQLYDLDQDVTNLPAVEGMQNYPIPAWKAKALRIIASVLRSLTSIEPYVQCVSESGTPEDQLKCAKLGSALMKLAQSKAGKYGFYRCLRQCLKEAVNSGIAFMYVHPDEDGTIKHEMIPPAEFCVYPHELGDLRQAKTIGFKFFQMIETVKERFESGEYLTDEVVGSNGVGDRGSQPQSFTGLVDTPARIPNDELVECWYIVRRCDFGDYEYKDAGTTVKIRGKHDYAITIAKDQQKVLKVEPVPYSRSRMFFDVRFEEDFGSIWPATAPGIDIIGLQTIISDSYNLQLQGSASTAFPPVAIIGGTLPKQLTRMGPGAVWELPSGWTLSSVPIQFNGSPLRESTQDAIQMLDALTRVNTAGISEPLPSGTSGTAAAGFFQAQTEGKDQYTQFVAPVLAEIWEFYQELLSVHWNTFKAKFGNGLGIDQWQDVNVRSKFEVVGQSNTSSPTALLHNLQVLLAVSADPEYGQLINKPEVLMQMLLALSFPFNPQNLIKQGASVQDIAKLAAGLITGQITPEEGAKALGEETGMHVQPPPKKPDNKDELAIEKTLVSKVEPTRAEQAQILARHGIQPQPGHPEEGWHQILQGVVEGKISIEEAKQVLGEEGPRLGIEPPASGEAA